MVLVVTTESHGAIHTSSPLSKDDHEIDSEGAPVPYATKYLVPPAYKQDGYERWDMESSSGTISVFKI
jgi:hypothetical protein